MNHADIDRLLADLDVLAAEDQRLTAHPAVRARVMAAWDSRAAATPDPGLRWWSYLGLVAVSAATVLLAVVLGTAGLSKRDSSPAVVEIVDGSLYRVLGGRSEPITVGGSLEYAATVRTTGGAGSQLRLADDSRVEMRAESELSVERAADGVRIRLARGSIIVHAAKQRGGHLYVQTRDMSVSVVGTVFLVNVEDQGSRVAVIEGEVRVQHGATAQRLRPGQQILTGSALEPNLVRDEIAWSRRAAALALLLQAASQNAPAAPRPTFDAADVRVSAPRPDGRGVVMEGGGAVRAGRYEIHNATMVDLIRTAYGVTADAVIGGPSWLATDRFTVIAKPPDDATAGSINMMLQSLLADRFRLVARADTRPLPAWVLSRGPGEPKMKRAAASEGTGCRLMFDINRMACRNVALDDFLASLTPERTTALPVLNQTGLEGAWDLDIDGVDLARARGIFEDSPMVAAIRSQLGLELAIRPVPRPVIVVDSVSRIPTPNVPGVETRLPSDPVEFEVASIRPCEFVNPMNNGGDSGVRVSPSGQVITGCRSLGSHISEAWGLCTNVQAVGRVNLCIGGDVPGAPGWLRSKYYTITAKAPVEVTRPLGADAKYRAMLRNLLVERFKMVTHYEDRPVEVYTLVAAAPRLRKADPSRRSGCRSTGLVFGAPTVITCENVTMGQFVEELNRSFNLVAAGGGRRVVDETGMPGTWDLTLSYRYGPPSATAPGVASEPTGELTLPDALERQLGLKLQEAKRPMPVFVMDRIEENPTEN